MSDDKILDIQSSAVNCLWKISDILRKRVVRITGDESKEDLARMYSWGIDNDKWSWGQYLDRVENVGVYGTSIGFQSLLICGELVYGETLGSEIIQKSMNWLISEYENPDSRANKKDDFNLILRVSYLVNALSAAGYDMNTPIMERAFEFLSNAQLNEGGWGFYYFGPQEKDNNGCVICTCNALLALRHSRDFRVTNCFIKGVTWLLDQIVNVEDAGTLALIITSLIELGVHKNLRAIQQGFSDLSKMIDNVDAWSLTQVFVSMRNNSSTFFQLGSRGYILKALTLLDVDLFVSNKALFQQLSETLRNIETNGSYKDSGRIWIRDVLGISDFLSTFVKTIDERQDYILLNQRLDSLEVEYTEIHQLMRSKSFKLMRFILKCTDRIFSWFKRLYAFPISIVLLLALWLVSTRTESKGFVWAILLAILTGIVANLITGVRKNGK
ncbi:hypothetical protein H8E77_21745 [bacterium]|nr:hypothetical protein [bacterium]